VPVTGLGAKLLLVKLNTPPENAIYFPSLRHHDAGCAKLLVHVRGYRRVSQAIHYRHHRGRHPHPGESHRPQEDEGRTTQAVSTVPHKSLTRLR
jgi:hypothetical protein